MITNNLRMKYMFILFVFFVTGCATMPSIHTSTDRKITQAEQQLNNTARDFIATASNILTQINNKQQNPELQQAINIINKSQILLRSKVDDGLEYHGLSSKELEHRINQAYDKNQDLIERIEHLESMRDVANDRLAVADVANKAVRNREFWDRFKWYSGAVVLLASFVMLLLYVPSAAIKNMWKLLNGNTK